jgi:hypothetical protein
MVVRGCPASLQLHDTLHLTRRGDQLGQLRRQAVTLDQRRCRRRRLQRRRGHRALHLRATTGPRAATRAFGEQQAQRGAASEDAGAFGIPLELERRGPRHRVAHYCRAAA